MVNRLNWIYSRLNKHCWIQYVFKVSEGWVHIAGEIKLKTNFLPTQKIFLQKKEKKIFLNWISIKQKCYVHNQQCAKDYKDRKISSPFI